MKILVTGRGTSGSWAIRGEQLGRAIGARVERQAAKLADADLVIVVKRSVDDLLRRIRPAPIVWDVVDAWPQPIGNTWSRDDCMAWLRGQIADIRPVAIVAATQRMAADCAEFGLPVLCLPHHARPGMMVNPIRPVVKFVGYEGGAQYLGAWQPFIEEECKARGWRFVVNPSSLAVLDIVVAVREATGYAPRHWKSNVKLANAQGSGTPCIVNREHGYIETATGGEMWADNLKEMADSLDMLTPEAMRRMVAAKLMPGPQLADLAETYKAWLHSLKS